MKYLPAQFLFTAFICSINTFAIIAGDNSDAAHLWHGSEYKMRQFDQQHSHYGYDLTKSLPGTFVTDGTVDYTVYLQQAINDHDTIIFPPFPIMINDNGLTIGSNKIITFSPGSVLLLQPSWNTLSNKSLE